MSHRETFAVIGGDLRSVYLAGSLAEDGYTVLTAGLDTADLPPCVTGCSHPAQTAALADWTILPFPLTQDGERLNAPFARHPILLSELEKAMKPGACVLVGGGPPGFSERLAARGVAVWDYAAGEELALLNSVPTAEGAIQLAMEELPITLAGARCLVTGYGRVGRSLAVRLAALGAGVTVAARRARDRAAATADGCAAVSVAEMTASGDFDVIFNTVPACVFTDEVLRRLPPSVLLMDLASAPGGVDFEAAAARHIKTVWARSLPGRVAPKTAAEIIKQTVLNRIEEGKP